MNENDEQDIDLNNEELEEQVEEVEDKSEDTPPVEKPKETPEAKKARLERQLKRLNKELGVEEPSESKTKSELGYAEKAFLVANDVKGSDEIKLAQEFMNESGKSLEEVLESKFFQGELKEMREAKASANAVPKGSKRSGQSSRDSVDYWLAKDTLPENTPENQELRRQIVDAKYKRETSGSKFSASLTGRVTRQSQQK